MLLLFLKCLAKLPLGVLRSLGDGIALLVFALSKKTRQRIAENLAQAQLNLSVLAVVQAHVRGLLDMVWVWFNPASLVAKHCNAQHTMLAQALDGTQATLLLTPHLGCFEALAKWIVTQTPLTAMYRRPDKAWVASLLEAARQTPNLTLAPADAGGVRLALKTLKSGRTLGILPDQVPRQGEGVWLPWFGREAYTITLPAKLILATQARVFIVAAIPNETNESSAKPGWDMVCEPVEVPANLNAEQLSLHLNRALERMVLRAPLHYAWSYKRYKEVAGSRP